jgi:hypothetical protein
MTELNVRKHSRGIFFGCCACAASGQATIPPSTQKTSRRLMAYLSGPGRDHRNREHKDSEGGSRVLGHNLAGGNAHVRVVQSLQNCDFRITSARQRTADILMSVENGRNGPGRDIRQILSARRLMAHHRTGDTRRRSSVHSRANVDYGYIVGIAHARATAPDRHESVPSPAPSERIGAHLAVNKCSKCI